MEYRKTFRTVGVAALVCAAAFAGRANAQSSGSMQLGIGWLHVMPQGNADPIVVESVAGAPVNQQQAGTGAHADASDAASLMAEYFVTDNIGVAFLAGTPFTTDLVGNNSLASFGVIGKTKPMAPVLEVRYHFLAADARFRPFVGLGVNYTWYSNTRIVNQAFLDATCGPGCTTRASLSASWNPTFELGANYVLAKHWSINASLSYIPLSTTLTTNAATASGVDIVTKMRIRVNPVVTHLDIAYTF
ncbi:OmpW family protein [Burkholderia lata]|uniref:OmpW/AlkL family protein n=1 Tax=Burkholderia lata (strain ATCC 17760 / DSM 23089 / LMG 22485 / NCIMB 9086 / R18194 / 383) TaxID=482957 RepID=UPI001453BA6B|nr:OmpW family outer membrane protein [Burkholderia lata]VWC18691.1 OmpW family protein [Burkholderia lata]